MPHRRTTDTRPGLFSASGWLLVAFAVGASIDAVLIDLALRLVG